MKEHKNIWECIAEAKKSMNGTLMGYTATGGSKIERTFSSFMKEVFLTTDGPEVVLSLKGPFYTRQRQSVVDEVVEKIKAEYADWHNGMKGLDKGEVFTILSVLSDYRIEKKSSIVEPEDGMDEVEKEILDMFEPVTLKKAGELNNLLSYYNITEKSDTPLDELEGLDFNQHIPSLDGPKPPCEHEYNLNEFDIMACEKCNKRKPEPSKASGIDECVEEYHLKATYTLVDRLRPLNPDEMREILTKHWPKTPDYEKVADRIRCNIISKRASQPIIEVVLETLKSELGDNK